MSNQNVKGTVIRGADGRLYFIPDGALEPYRIPEQEYPNIAGKLTANGIDVDGHGEQAKRVIVDEAAALGMQNGLVVDNTTAMGIHNTPPLVDNTTAMGIHNTPPLDEAAAMGMINNSLPADEKTAMGIQNSLPADDAIASDDQRQQLRDLTD